MLKKMLMILAVIMSWNLTEVTKDAWSGSDGGLARPSLKQLPNQTLLRDVYRGPEGTNVEIRGAVQHGAKLTELMKRGIIIINGKPRDGKYVGSNGQTFLVERGIIIVDVKPVQKRLRVR